MEEEHGGQVRVSIVEVVEADRAVIQISVGWLHLVSLSRFALSVNSQHGDYRTSGMDVDRYEIRSWQWRYRSLRLEYSTGHRILGAANCNLGDINRG